MHASPCWCIVCYFGFTSAFILLYIHYLVYAFFTTASFILYIHHLVYAFIVILSLLLYSTVFILLYMYIHHLVYVLIYCISSLYYCIITFLHASSCLHLLYTSLLLFYSFCAFVSFVCISRYIVFTTAFILFQARLCHNEFAVCILQPTFIFSLSQWIHQPPTFVMHSTV